MAPHAAEVARHPSQPPRSGGDGALAIDAAKNKALLVVKKLSPPQRGTARWLRRYGSALLCVRYRLDARRGVRYTTVELVVETRKANADDHAKVLLPIDSQDEALRRQAVQLGAKWKRRDKAWLMTRAAAIQLGLLAPPEADASECP